MSKNQNLKKLLCAFLSVLIIISSISAVFASNGEIKGHWAEIQLNDWIERGLVTGYVDGTYKPNSKITRSEFIALVNRTYGFDEKGQVEFTDVNSESNPWVYGEVAKAKKAGYINGYVDGSFKPNNNITRQEVAAIILRLEKLEPNSDVEMLNKFKDAGEIPEWSKGNIGAVVEKGYMRGTPENEFRALDQTSRAEVVTALDRVITRELTSAEAKPLFDAIKKQQQIKTIESKGSLNLTLNASGLTEENQAVFDEISNVINSAQIDVESKAMANDEGTKSMAEAKVSVKAKGTNIGTTIWMDGDISSDSPKFTEVIQIPEIFAGFMPEELQGKDYLVIDGSQGANQTALGNSKELIETSKKLQDKIIAIIGKYMDEANANYGIIKDRGIKVINNAEGKEYARIYRISLDDTTLKAVIKESINYMVQDKDFVKLIKEYMLAVAELETNPEAKAELEKAAAELENNTAAFAESFNKVMDILDDVTLIGKRGISIDYTVSSEGYIINEKGNIDFVVDVAKLGNVFSEISGEPIAEDVTVSGVYCLGIDFNTDTLNINGDIKIEMPKLTAENSITIEELTEAFAAQEVIEQ